MIGVRGEVLAEAHETWTGPGGFRLLPRVPSMKKRVRVEVPFEIEVVDGFDAVKKRKRDRAHGERTAFLGRVDYCDEAA